jgi:hypothetical protein
VCEMTRVLISVSKLVVRGRSFPECCFHGFGNDTRSVGHVGGLRPARGHRLKILVGVLSPDYEQRIHGDLRDWARSVVVGHKTPSKSRQGRSRCRGHLVWWWVMVIVRGRRVQGSVHGLSDQGSVHGLSAQCRVLNLTVRVLWRRRGILHDVVGGDEGFRGQKKSRRRQQVNLSTFLKRVFKELV